MCFGRLQNQPLYCTNSMFSWDNNYCVQLNGRFCNISKRTWLYSFNNNFLIFLSDFDKFGIKISSKHVFSTWCTPICSILSSFLNIVTFTSGKELFLTSLYNGKSCKWMADELVKILGKRHRCNEIHCGVFTWLSLSFLDHWSYFECLRTWECEVVPDQHGLWVTNQGWTESFYFGLLLLLFTWLGHLCRAKNSSKFPKLVQFLRSQCVS